MAMMLQTLRSASDSNPRPVQINLVYFNASNALQQSVFNGGSWHNAPILPGPSPPSASSKLSTSTSFFSQSPEGEPPSYWFSFVAAYQSADGSLVIIDVGPLDNFSGRLGNNLNLLSSFNNTQEAKHANLFYTNQQYKAESFAVSHAIPSSWNDSSFLHTFISVGNGLPSLDTKVIFSAWTYTENELYEDSTIPNASAYILGTQNTPDSLKYKLNTYRVYGISR